MKLYFRKFCKNSKKNSTFNKLKDIDWNVCEVKDRPYQSETGGRNCALYNLYFVECRAKNLPCDPNVNPEEYRLDVAHRLLLKSEDMNKVCVNCTKFTTEKDIKCNGCRRRCHESCLLTNEKDTDDEQPTGKKIKLEKKLKTNKKMNQ